LWSLYVPILQWTRPHALEGVLRHTIGTRWREVIDTYARSHYAESQGSITMGINGDLLFRMPAIRLAEAQCVHRPTDTRMYLFAWRTPVMGGRLGSPHAIDVPFVFGNLDAKGVELYTGPGADRRVVSNAVQDAWIAFARSGDPGHPGLPEWPACQPVTRATLTFDTTPTVKYDPMPEEREIWGDVPFDGVHPALEHSLPSTRSILGSFLKAPSRS
jgi:para-nitrobenzyl esterase